MGIRYDMAIEKLKKDIRSKGKKASYQDLLIEYQADREFLDFALEDLLKERELYEPTYGFLAVVDQ